MQTDSFPEKNDKQTTSHSHAKKTSTPLIHGESQSFQHNIQQAQRIALTKQPTLIIGATGVGKGMIAQAIHQHSNESDAPFVEIQCGTIPEHIMESELFGHIKGAFDGAIAEREGYFSAVGLGSILFDEIAELPLSLQPKLLHILESRTFRKLGSNIDSQFEGRIIATTNQDLQQLVRQGKFREDLFHRLNLLVIEIAGLNERREDIPHLLKYFLNCQPRKLGLSSDALAFLCHHQWNGHVRELRNLIDRMAILADTPYITADVIKKFLPHQKNHQQETQQQAAKILLALEGEDKLQATENYLIQFALQENQGNKALAAKTLGISPEKLEHKIIQFENDYTRAQQLIQAAQREIKASHYLEAITNLEKALKLSLNQTGKNDHRLMLFEIYHLLGVSYRSHQGWLSQDAQAAYVATLSIGCQLGNEVDITPLLFGIWSTQLMMLDLKKARHTAQDMLQHAVLSENNNTIADAYFAMANTLFWMGDCKGVLNYLNQGKLIPMVLHENSTSQGLDLIGLAITFEGLAAFHLGEFTRAHDAMQKLILRGSKENHHAFNRAIALQGAAWIACLFNDLMQLKILSRQLEHLSKEHNFPFYQGIGQVFRGYAMIQEQAYREAEALIQDGYENYMLINGGKLFHSFQAWKKAEVQLLSGNSKKSEAICNLAIDIALACEERIYLSELLTTQANAKAHLGDLQGAEQCYQEALSIADVLGSVSGKIYALTHFIEFSLKHKSPIDIKPIVDKMMPTIDDTNYEGATHLINLCESLNS